MFYRRLYIAHLIDSGINTVPKLIKETGMHRRTLQDTITGLADLDIECEFHGATKDGSYVIIDWAGIDPEWVENHLRHIKSVLQ